MAIRGTDSRSVRVVPANIRDASYILANMRQQDKAEVLAAVGDEHPSVLACWLLAATDLAFVASINGNPVCVFGVSPVRGHIWAGWALGTDRLKRVIPAVTKVCLGVIKPELIERGALRLQVHTLPEHDLSHSWLQGMGAQFEGVCRSYGVNGEDFHVYAWARKPE